MGLRGFSFLASNRRGLAVRGLTVAVVSGTVGVLLMPAGSAATYVANHEAESGTISGVASEETVAGASGGRAVKFGLASTVSWPTSPPAPICGNQAYLGGGPASAPAGAVTVPAGDNSSMLFTLREANKTFWFAPGVHTLGGDEFGQIEAGAGSTYIGAPGAIIDGQRLNRFAFTQQAANVTIKYLTIRNFVSPLDQGVVNHDAGVGWKIENNTITQNDGAALMGSQNGVYRYNCLKDNGQYAINSCCGGDTAATDIQNFVVDHNELVGNNTGDWENRNNGCGCTGGVKFWINKDVTFTNNWVHDNKSVGVWLDNNNRGFTIENNLIENNDAEGLFVESGYDVRVRYNNFKRNALVKGREFRNRNDPFPISAIYISDNGSPSGYGLKYVPSVFSHNNFDNNWSGIGMWENADRYSGSSAHTHISGTVKVGTLYDDAACDGANDTIPASVGDKYRCRWSTENNIVENNIFRIDKAAIGTGCAGANYCGINGIFSNYGSYPEFSGATIPWRITFQQGNIFRNNSYHGDWRFAGFQTTQPDGQRVTWQNWRAPAPQVPAVFTNDNRPSTFGQDLGSTLTP